MSKNEVLAFIAGLLVGGLLVSAFTPTTVAYTKTQEEVLPDEEDPAIPTPMILATSTSAVELYNPDKHITAMAEKYGQSEWLAREIMRCEGIAYALRNDIPWGEVTNVNYNASGTPWSVDIGPWQINDYYHQATMMEMEMNIHDVYDNIEYGFMLLASQGTQPWSASQYCWDA